MVLREEIIGLVNGRKEQKLSYFFFFFFFFLFSNPKK